MVELDTVIADATTTNVNKVRGHNGEENENLSLFGCLAKQ